MGVYDRSCEQLASSDMALAHGGCLNVRDETRGPSCDESFFSCGELNVVVIAALADDWLGLAQCDGGCVVRAASVACGIRGLGGGTKRCALSVLWSALALGIRLLREARFILECADKSAL